MPAPITAPTPSAVSDTGPRVRFRCSPPSSLDSEIIRLRGFLLKRFAIRMGYSFVCRLAEVRLDQNRYTGMPSKTRARPGHVYCGLYRNNTTQIHPARVM